MANYFVIDNTFRPYSFDELIKPYQMYGEAYKQQEALLDAAREKEFSADRLDKELDKEAYDMYTQATSGLRAASDELATRGLSAKLRGTIRNTARDYQTTMATLNQAQTELAAERLRRANLGPDYVFQQNDVRIGDYLGGRAANQRGESLKTITSDVASEFAALAGTISKDTWSKALLDGKQTGYFDIKTEKGLTDAQLRTILADTGIWENVMSDPTIDARDKEKLQGFRDIITSKLRAVGFDDYDNETNKDKIADAIARGAHAGLGSTSHAYQQDKSYDPVGWANYNFSVRKYNDALRESEAPYEHTNEEKPTMQNRTGKLKPGYSIVNGKLQYRDPNSPVADSSTGGTDYTLKTPEITVHAANGIEGTYSSMEDVREAGLSGRIDRALWMDWLAADPNILDVAKPIAIQDIEDDNLKRALLTRINVPNVSLTTSDALSDAIIRNLARLNQLSVRVAGTPNTDEYAWIISDKNTQRLSGEGGGEVFDPDDKDIR